MESKRTHLERDVRWLVWATRDLYYTSLKFIADFWKVVIRIEVSYTDLILRFVCFGYSQKNWHFEPKGFGAFQAVSRLGCRGVHPPITSFVVSGSCMKCEANENTLRSPKHSGRVVVLREMTTSTFQWLGGGFNYVLSSPLFEEDFQFD